MQPLGTLYDTIVALRGPRAVFYVRISSCLHWIKLTRLGLKPTGVVQKPASHVTNAPPSGPIIMNSRRIMATSM